MCGDLLGVSDADEIAGQTDVVEIELGRFDEALSYIDVIGLELKYDVGSSPAR